jgi:tetratricopeptide (TPR) repeat protein
MTVNGIGTHYYGKRNRQARVGVCHSCGAQTNLESYDTRLWFVFIMIPLIPLGRRRIIDQCPHCSRHFAANPQQWETSKQLGVSGTMHAYREQPSPEAALEVHASFLAFRMQEEAAVFRSQAMQDFPESALLPAGLAAQLRQMGLFDESTTLFDKALQLHPDLPDARVGAAISRIVAGELDQARELLRFLEEPGAGQLYNLGPLETLAHAYQKAGRHEQTLAICRHLLEEIPEAGQLHEFRKFVKTSEKALGEWQTILPKHGFSLGGLFSAKSGRYSSAQRWTAIAAVVTLLVVVGMCLVNEHHRRHRTVFALNDCGCALQVSVDGGEAVEVVSMTKLEMPEGRHHVKVSEPLDEEFEIDMRTGYFERWTKSPAWVLNLGGASAFTDQAIHYAVAPPPPDVRFVVGERFYYAPHVDYPFENPPDSLRVEGKNSSVTKTHLGRIRESSRLLFQLAAGTVDMDAALRFAESRLRGNPQDAELLETYVSVSQRFQQDQRVDDFLASRLWIPPISIPWHRTYHNLEQSAPREARLAQEYDARLKESPSDAGLLYLRGRVASDSREARKYFEKSIEIDPGLPWPWMALAYDAASHGDWTECRTLSRKAFDLGLDDSSVRSLRHSASLAVGETSDLEQDYRRHLETTDLQESAVAMINLCDLLVSDGKIEEAKKALSQWQDTLPADVRSADWVDSCRQTVLYILADLDALDAPAVLARDTIPADTRIYYLAVLGRPAELANDPTLEKALAEPWNAVAVSVAFSLQGNEVEAANWRERACARFHEQTATMQRVAAVLRGPTAPTQDQLNAIVLHPGAKALLLASLSLRFPDQKRSLAEQARKLNVSRKPPCQLVRQAIELES